MKFTTHTISLLIGTAVAAPARLDQFQKPEASLETRQPLGYSLTEGEPLNTPALARRYIPVVARDEIVSAGMSSGMIERKWFVFIPMFLAGYVGFWTGVVVGAVTTSDKKEGGEENAQRRNLDGTGPAFDPEVVKIMLENLGEYTPEELDPLSDLWTRDVDVSRTSLDGALTVRQTLPVNETAVAEEKLVHFIGETVIAEGQGGVEVDYDAARAEVTPYIETLEKKFPGDIDQLLMSVPEWTDADWAEITTLVHNLLKGLGTEEPNED
ncbi:hypothetical protein F5X68DRAFT_186731 [Plectosphaerella plurivora]|uniref:Transmembrane protein n=1 Tax=Plectosphaerella plurivora TaxID=936078 RepID=A0A9P8VM61_9PEZI|nr:hypothetical protein F5X68DRAFT_186731 [Plectosphaerella plurivora]